MLANVEIVLLDYFPPSLNQVRGQHWSAPRRSKQECMKKLASSCFIQHQKIPEFAGKVKVSVVRYWGKGQRALDHDNLTGAVKPLIDCMRAKTMMRNKRGICFQGGLGIIERDDPDYLDLHVSQEKSTDDHLKTVITVEGNRVN